MEIRSICNYFPEYSGHYPRSPASQDVNDPATRPGCDLGEDEKLVVIDKKGAGKAIKSV